MSVYRAHLAFLPPLPNDPAEKAAYCTHLRNLADDEKIPGFPRVKQSEVVHDKIKHGGYDVPAGTPLDKADRAFDVIFDKIMAYLSSPDPLSPDPPYRVGACKSCGKEDCFATAEPWAAPLIYSDGEAYIGGGLCCADRWREEDFHSDCAHPMVPTG
jgi:hypothetical protein